LIVIVAFSLGKSAYDESVMINIPCEESEVWSECCIYKVPDKLRKVNEEAYTPKLVSIGPFHHDLEELWGVKIQKKYIFEEVLF
jgi:hypothetical protein